MTINEGLKWFDKSRKAGERKTKKKFFDLVRFLREFQENNCLYGLVYGERSNAKTYGLLYYGLLLYVVTGKPFAIVRRFDTDIRAGRAKKLFTNLSNLGAIDYLTGGMWDQVYYYGGMWFLARENTKGELVHASQPFAAAYALNVWEHDKSTGDLGLSMILFDEFISKQYILDEFSTFMNVVSSLVRNANDIPIFMSGNSINPHGCPYFRDMGLTKAKTMRPGQIDIYHYADSRLHVLIHRTEPSGDEANSAVYFAFDNPKLAMITRGDWDIEVYPHIPHKLKGIQPRFRFFVSYEDQLLACSIVRVEGCLYITVSPKTSPLLYPDRDLIYCHRPDPRPNWRQDWRKPRYKIEGVINQLFRDGKVFYTDNMTGEVLRNYIENAG